MTKEVVHVIVIKEDNSKESNPNHGRDNHGKCRHKLTDVEGMDNDSFTGSCQDEKVISRSKAIDPKEVILELNRDSLTQRFLSSLKSMDTGPSCLTCTSANSSIREVSRKASDDSDSSGKTKCCSGCRRKPVDDIDGPATNLIIASVLKLTFLKILLIDIGISVGDAVTDFLQGFNLIWDYSDMTLNSASYHYGIAVIATSWIPSLVTLVHLWLSQEFQFLKKLGWANSCLFLFVFICLFPFMPTLFYFQLLLQRRRTYDELKEYKTIQRRANEIKSIAGAIEAPIQLITVFWLMMRGILTMPWDEGVSSTCVEDSLGRVACFPSIPMASMLFSSLSIMKSMFDINISPLLSSHRETMSSLKQSFQLFLRFAPFFFANAIFRVCSYAFIILFIDYWATIPGVLLFGINLVIFGISFTRTKDPIPPENDRRNAVPLQPISTAALSVPRQIQPEQQQFRVEPIGWNENLTIFSPSTPTEEQPTSPGHLRPIWTPAGQDMSLSAIIRPKSPNHSTTPSFINEENTSIFLNSICGLFIPSCHTHLKEADNLPNDYDDISGENNIQNIRLNNLFLWQKRVFRKQVFILNSIVAFTVICVTILVSSVDTFNYEANVMNPFWFRNASIFLLIMWLVTVILAFEPDSAKMVRTIRRIFSEKCIFLSSPNGLDSNDGPLPRCPEPSSSQRSTSFLMNKKKPEKSTVTHSAICFFICILILLPAITGVLMFHYSSRPEPHIYFMDDGVGSSSMINMTIITAFPISTLSVSKLDLISGTLETECFIDETTDFSDKIIVVNRTSPKCSALLKEENFNKNVIKSNAKAILILDNTPKYQWRVSSPFHIHSFKEETYPDIPILMIRQTDWSRFNAYFGGTGNQVFLVFSATNHLDLTNLLSCTKSSSISVGSPQELDRPQRKEVCSQGKHLYQNGTLSEQVCVKSECWHLGQRCPQSYFENIRKFNVNLKCDTESLSRTKMDFKSVNSDRELEPSSMERSGSGKRSKYCCRRNDTGISTFLKVLGSGCFDKFRDVVRYLDSCQFTEYIEDGDCGEYVEEQQAVARYCKVHNHECVIKEYYYTYCDSHEALDKCRRKEVQC